MAEIDQVNFTLQDLEEEPLVFQGEVDRDNANRYSDSDSCHGIGRVKYKKIGKEDYVCDEVKRETLKESIERMVRSDMTFTSDMQITCSTEEATNLRIISALSVAVMRSHNKYLNYILYEKGTIINKDKVLYNRNEEERPNERNIDFDNCRDTLFERGICNVDKFGSYTTFIQQTTEESGVLILNNGLGLKENEEKFNIKEEQLYNGFTIQFLCIQDVEIPEDNYFTLKLDVNGEQVSLTKKLYETTNIEQKPLSKIKAGEVMQLYYTNRLEEEGVFVLFDNLIKVKKELYNYAIPVNSIVYCDKPIIPDFMEGEVVFEQIKSQYIGASDNNHLSGTTCEPQAQNIRGTANAIWCNRNRSDVSGPFTKSSIDQWSKEGREQDCSTVYDISFDATRKSVGESENSIYRANLKGNDRLRPATYFSDCWKRVK